MKPFENIAAALAGCLIALWLVETITRELAR
jgi:hypothetical protein